MMDRAVSLTWLLQKLYWYRLFAEGQERGQSQIVRERGSIYKSHYLSFLIKDILGF